MQLAQSFSFAPHASLEPAARQKWWQGLDDALLDELVEQAMQQNLDLEIAQARIESARSVAQATGRSAQVSGSLNASAQASRSEGADWSRSSRLEIQPSFVVDLFGRQTRATEAAIADLASAEFSKAAARLAIQLELVTTYLDLRAQQVLETELHRAVGNRLRLVETLNARVDAQEALLLDLRNAEAEVASARARVPGAQAEQKLAILRIATLLAVPANELIPVLDKRVGQPMPKSGFDPGVPASLLKNRPDVRRAEASFASAVAEVGVREADLYPSLQVGGTIRMASVGLVQLGPALSIPVLDRPRRKAQLEAARAEAVAAQALWRRTVLEAVEEVQASLVRLESRDQELARLGRAVRKLNSARRLSSEAFDLGAITLTETISAEQRTLNTRINVLDARRAYASAWAQLNVAIGQGWAQAYD